MKVKELIAYCYDTIVIYTHVGEEMLDYKDLYKGDKNNIPNHLMESQVKLFGAKKINVIDILI